jgi:CheY-like chemotaxis protein
MALRLCPKCHCRVDAEAARCDACGSALPLDDTVPAAFDATPRHKPEPEAEPLLELTLRSIDAPPPPDEASALAANALADADAPGPGGVIGIEKAAKRAAVRRARLRRTAAPVECVDVLVYDPDEGTRAPLCALLGGFGFQIHVASDIAAATTFAGSRCLAASFVDVTFDGAAAGPATALCRVLKAARRSMGGASAALLLYASGVSPVGWIRAQLAGCDALLGKPATRGELARVLESCAVALPYDARRG